MKHSKTTRWKPANQLEGGKYPPHIRATLYHDEYGHEEVYDDRYRLNDERIVHVDEEYHRED